jgi:hypothetical protein
VLERDRELRRAVNEEPVAHKLAEHPCRGTRPRREAQCCGWRGRRRRGRRLEERRHGFMLSSLVFGGCRDSPPRGE